MPAVHSLPIARTSMTAIVQQQFSVRFAAQQPPRLKHMFGIQKPQMISTPVPTPVVQKQPRVLTATITTTCSNDTVSDITLPANWQWKNSDADKVLTLDSPVSAVAVYEGADKANYSTTELTITITTSHTGETTLKNVKENGEWIQVPTFKNERPEFPYGHGEKSVDILRDYIQLTLNEKLAIRYHMGPYDSKENWNDLGYAQELSPLAFWLHVADAYVSRYIC